MSSDSTGIVELFCGQFSLVLQQKLPQHVLWDCRELWAAQILKDLFFFNFL